MNTSHLGYVDLPIYYNLKGVLMCIDRLRFIKIANVGCTGMLSPARGNCSKLMVLASRVVLGKGLVWRL